MLLARCARYQTADSDQLLDETHRGQIDADYHALGQRGLRGLTLAVRVLPASSFDASAELSAWVNDLTFVGLIGLLDPPRAEAKHAIAQCQHAGIAVKMITGDHQTTALAIAAELGLHGRAVRPRT